VAGNAAAVCRAQERRTRVGQNQEHLKEGDSRNRHGNKGQIYKRQKYICSVVGEKVLIFIYVVVKTKGRNECFYPL
jgi:hypothetical protein